MQANRWLIQHKNSAGKQMAHTTQEKVKTGEVGYNPGLDCVPTVTARMKMSWWSAGKQITTTLREHVGNERVHVLFCVSNQILWCALGQSRGWAVCNGQATLSRLCVCVCMCVCVIRVCRGHYVSVLGVMAFYFQEREIDPAGKPKDTGTN